jgi:hypothetical protein
MEALRLCLHFWPGCAQLNENRLQNKELRSFWRTLPWLPQLTPRLARFALSRKQTLPNALQIYAYTMLQITPMLASRFPARQWLAAIESSLPLFRNRFSRSAGLVGRQDWHFSVLL